MAYKFVTSRRRSFLMSQIGSYNTKPELLLRKALWRQGFRFSRKVSELSGKPDIVLKKYRAVIFVDGEFWHGFQWKKKKVKIKDNRAYWIPKIERNITRDKKNTHLLRLQGWKVIRIWEHKINKDLPKCVEMIKTIVKE
jgi:DNA mismatch endonuclease (patch repair protein)